MKYKVLNISSHDLDIITEDGGVAEITNEFGNYATLYYQSRITPEMNEGEIQDTLMDSKSYYKEHSESATREQVILDALQWLCVGAEWQEDNTIFPNL
jgi:hypothetical protein